MRRALDQGGDLLVALLMAGNVHRISLWAGGLVLFLCAIYYAFVHRHMRR